MLGLLLLTIAAGACALPSLRVMEEHGVNVVCYQLARTTDQASEYNRMLGGEGRDATRTALWWDFPLLVSYGLLLAVLCLGVATRAADRGRRWFAVHGRQFAALALVAAACDAAENVALLRVVDGETDQPWPGVAFGFAAVKWLLVLGSATYLAAGWLLTRQASIPTDRP